MMTPPSTTADPRVVLGAQVAIAVAVFAHPPRIALPLGVVLVGGVGLWLRPSWGRLWGPLRVAGAFLVAAPIIAAVQLVPPGVDPLGFRRAAVASARVLLVLICGLTLSGTQTPQQLRVAVSGLIPGRPGRLAAVGVWVLATFIPHLRAELRRLRRAWQLRCGFRRSRLEQLTVLGRVALAALIDRAEVLIRALQLRCLSWRPTPPVRRLGPTDTVVLVLSVLLAASPLLVWLRA
jgi:biotin transport system permease protein